jgi:hypothetical protein
MKRLCDLPVVLPDGALSKVLVPTGIAADRANELKKPMKTEMQTESMMKKKVWKEKGEEVNSTGCEGECSNVGQKARLCM